MLTLLEQAKLVNDPLAKGVISVFPQVSPVLERLPFFNVSSDVYKYNREQLLPSSSFRSVNEQYTESTGSLDQVIESLAIAGGVSDVDRALVKTQGNLNDIRSIHDAMKAKSCALHWTKNFIKGDILTDPEGFDGLQARCSGSQKIVMGATGGGDTLTLAKLDELIDAIEGSSPDVLFMNKIMRRKVNTLVRAAGSAIETVSDSFGRQINAYAGIPIAVIDVDEANNQILPFTEATSSGASTGTSIYAVRFGVGEYCFGLQCGEMEVIDEGLVNSVWYRTLVEWISGFTCAHPRSAARLWAISNT